MENVNEIRVVSNTPPPSTYPAISVIIPLYNAEKYIAECLESILNQTFQNFEVIVVDDCSTDKSLVIVESYRKKFGGRLNLLCMEENTGHGAMPRNKGFVFSRGGYVFNMDNDDMLTKTALEEMYMLAKEYDADVVYCEKNYESNADGSNIRLVPRQRFPVEQPTFESEDLAERVKKLLRTEILGTPWCKLVKRNLLADHEIYFQKVCPCDDYLWTLNLLFFAKKFLHVPNSTYIWRKSENSILRRKKNPQQDMNLWLNSAILGLKGLDKTLGKLDFFRGNPKYRFDVLNHFLTKMVFLSLRYRLKLQAFDIYSAIKQEFGESLGKQDVLVAALFTLMDRIDKESIKRKERIKELETKINEIQQLEAELLKLKGNIKI